MRHLRQALRACIAITGLCASLVAAASPTGACGTVRVGLNTVAADTWFTGERDSPEGPLADLARTALAAQGCQVVVQRLPLARLLLDAQQGLVDVVLVVTATDERRKALRFPETDQGDLDKAWALGKSRVSLFALASNADALNHLRLASKSKSLTVLVQRGSVGEELAKEAGWTLSYTPDAERAVTMLRLDRADLMIAPDWSISANTLAQAPAVRALDPPLRLAHYYAPVSRAFWERDPQRVKALWQALCQHVGMLGGDAACQRPPSKPEAPKKAKPP